MPFTLESPVFKQNGQIPQKYTCEGEDISPPLDWKNAPPETQSFAIIVEDPDAPDPKAPKMNWVHWIIYNIPKTVHSLPENIHSYPKGTCIGYNDQKRQGYQGPCPPIGRHHYHHRIFALDIILPEKGIKTRNDLEKVMKGHILAQTELVGTYQKMH